MLRKKASGKEKQGDMETKYKRIKFSCECT